MVILTRTLSSMTMKTVRMKNQTKVSTDIDFLEAEIIIASDVTQTLLCLLVSILQYAYVLPVSSSLPSISNSSITYFLLEDADGRPELKGRAKWLKKAVSAKDPLEEAAKKEEKKRRTDKSDKKR